MLLNDVLTVIAALAVFAAVMVGGYYLFAWFCEHHPFVLGWALAAFLLVAIIGCCVQQNQVDNKYRAQCASEQGHTIQYGDGGSRVCVNSNGSVLFTHAEFSQAHGGN